VITAVAIALSSIGGLLEAGGLILVVREIASDRNRGRELLRVLDAPRSPERHYPGRVSASPFTSELTNPAFTTPHHVRAIADRIQRDNASIANAFVALKKATDNELDNAIGLLQQDVLRRDAELRDGLRYVVAGSARDRMLGIALLGLGIVFGTAGSILGNL
jgi:hypothetical protein